MRWIGTFRLRPALTAGRASLKMTHSDVGQLLQLAPEDILLGCAAGNP
jgi:hypothetical protein